MLWVPLSIAVALLQAALDAVSKYALRTSDIYTIAWVQWGFWLKGQFFHNERILFRNSENRL